MARSRKIPILAPADLDAMHTGSLLTRLRELLKCEESFLLSDRWEHGVLPASSGFIEFKDTDEWRAAHQELKNILSRREHLPTAAERRVKRVLRASSNRTKERRA